MKRAITIFSFIVCVVLICIFIKIFFFNTKNTNQSNQASQREELKDWKKYVNDRYYGISFNYPANWSVQDGNAGIIFTSPDKQMMFSVAGPYPGEETPGKLAVSDSLNAQLVSKSTLTIAGHTGIQQEVITSNGNKYSSIENIADYIGNVKNISHWQNGTLNIEYVTMIFYMSIYSQSDKLEAAKTFDEIMTSLTLPK